MEWFSLPQFCFNIATTLLSLYGSWERQAHAGDCGWTADWRLEHPKCVQMVKSLWDESISEYRLDEQVMNRLNQSHWLQSYLGTTTSWQVMEFSGNTNSTKGHCQLQTETATWYQPNPSPKKFMPAPSCRADGFPILIFSFFVLFTFPISKTTGSL